MIDIAQIDFNDELQKGVYLPIYYHKNPMKKAQNLCIKAVVVLVLLDDVIIKS